MKSLRAYLAAAAVALAGFAVTGTAAAAPALPGGPTKLVLKLCIPHYEKKVVYAGIKKIGYRYYRVYRVYTIYVDRLCRKHVVRVHYIYRPLWVFRAAPGA